METLLTLIADNGLLFFSISLLCFAVFGIARTMHVRNQQQKGIVITTSAVGCLGCLTIAFMIASIISCGLSAISLALRLFWHH